MKKHILPLTALFLILILLQVCIFDEIHLFGVATPLVYVYFLIKLPVRTDRNLVLFLAALLGLILDLMGDTLGLNMLAMVVAGFLRIYFLRLFAPRDMADDCIPSVSTFSRNLFLRYAAMILLVHHAVLFVTEAGHAIFLPLLFARIAGSFLLTMLIIYGGEMMREQG